MQRMETSLPLEKLKNLKKMKVVKEQTPPEIPIAIQTSERVCNTKKIIDYLSNLDVSRYKI